MVDPGSRYDSGAHFELLVKFLDDRLQVEELTRLEKLLLDDTRIVDQLASLTVQMQMLRGSLASEFTAALDMPSNDPLLTPGCDGMWMRWWRTLNRTVGQPIPISLVIASLIMSIIVLGLASWDVPAWRGASPANDLPAFVARVVRTNEARWSDATEVDAGRVTDLFEGQQLELISGLAEIKFDEDAVVVLEGPSRFEIQSSGAMRLISGSLLGEVPAAAVGFVVVTPSARIIDLGTEFGVHVDRDGNEEMHVFQGSVQVLAGEAEYVLTSNQALKINQSATLRTTASSRDFHNHGKLRRPPAEIAWGDPQVTEGPQCLIAGPVVFAVNGGPATTAGGIDFEAIDLPEMGVKSSIYDDQPITSTGDVGFDLLLSTSAVLQGEQRVLPIRNLEVGQRYRVQVFYNEQKPGPRGWDGKRRMTFDNDSDPDNGNEVDVPAGRTDEPGPTDDYGWHAVGEFTAVWPVKSLVMRANDFANVHLTAVLVVELASNEGATDATEVDSD
ncbi:MAG: hypothetical protein WEA31_10640 [Pirellulales bacterium]